MTDRYKNFVDAVSNAGFFTTSVESMQNWDRVTVCSKRLPGPRYTGNSFWVSRRGDNWFVGTWGGSIYQVASEDVLIEFTTEWLTVEPNVTAADIAPEIREKYSLASVSDRKIQSLFEDPAEQ
jgi:hypothetical protein